MKYMYRLIGKDVPMIVEGGSFHDSTTGSKVYHGKVVYEEGKYYYDIRGNKFSITNNGSKKVIMRQHTLIVKDKGLAKLLAESKDK